MRALQKERGQRYATAEEFRQAVLACAGLPPGRLRVELRAPTEGGGPAASEGQWWPSYDHVELIRAARFARVFRGVDRTEREARCIKELSIPEFGAALDTRARSLLVGNLTRLFQNEIHLLAHLGSNVRRPEGVVQIYQIWPGDADHPAAYSMELLERTLEDHLRAQGPLSLLDALSLGLRLAQRVAELHTTGTVHRNLTPSSIMFSREGEICLVGFDRACRMMDHDALLAAEAALQAVVTIPTHALGHPAYLSPEQCRTEPFDQRTDIYSLGCVIYRLIAGRPPFVNDDPVALMLSHLAEMPRALADLAERVPSQLDDLFARVLAKHPEDRLPSAQEFAGQLQKITDRVGRAR
jgi:serine/threonine protein kinase